MKKISIQNTFEQWHGVRTAIANDLEPAILRAKQQYSHEDMLICALLKQLLQRIDVRLASGKSKFTIALTYPEAMGLHQAFFKDIISPDYGSWHFFLLNDIYLTVDKQAI